MCVNAPMLTDAFVDAGIDRHWHKHVPTHGAYTYTYVRTYVHAYMHTCIHAYMHTCIHAYIHTCIHAYMHTCMHACIHTYIHTYMHTCMHTYIPHQQPDHLPRPAVQWKRQALQYKSAAFPRTFRASVFDNRERERERERDSQREIECMRE